MITFYCGLICCGTFCLTCRMYNRSSVKAEIPPLVVREGIAGGREFGTFTINKLIKNIYVN